MDRATRSPFLWLIVVALVVRLGVAAVYADAPLSYDPRDYDLHARSIAAGDGYPGTRFQGGGATAVRPPGFPFLLALVYASTGAPGPPDDPGGFLDAPPGRPPGHVIAGRILQAILGTAVVALIGLLAAQLWDRRTALVAIAIAAVFPPLIFVGISLMSEPLFVALVLASLAAALEYRRRGAMRWAGLAGVCLGLASLTRSNGPLLLLPLVALLWGRPRWSRAAWRAPTLAVLAAVLVVLPWTVRNVVQMNAFIPISTQGAYTLAGTYNDTARSYDGVWIPTQLDPAFRRRLGREPRTEAEADRVAGRWVRDYVKDHPGYVLEVAGRNLLRITALDGGDFLRSHTVGELEIDESVVAVGQACLYALLLLALAGALTRQARRVPLSLWLVPLILLATSVVVQPFARHRAVVDAFLVLLAACAVARLPRPFRAPDGRATTRADPRGAGAAPRRDPHE